MFTNTKKQPDCTDKRLDGDEYNPIGRVFFFGSNCPFSSRVFHPDLLGKMGIGLGLNINVMVP
jgi:hypothetical protein